MGCIAQGPVVAWTRPKAAGRIVEDAARGMNIRQKCLYFSLASARSASARSVFSHENAVKVLPSAAFTS